MEFLYLIYQSSKHSLVSLEISFSGQGLQTKQQGGDLEEGGGRAVLSSCRKSDENERNEYCCGISLQDWAQNWHIHGQLGNGIGSKCPMKTTL